MAKETKYPAVTLFISSSLLLAGGWLMGPFPVFIFFGLAPLFALADRAESTSSAWEKMEWVLLALTVSFLASHSFDLSYLVSSIALAILFTLPFLGQVWVRHTLGPRVGKVTIVFFWLAIEYILLKVMPDSSVFLADVLQQEPLWVRWNIHTGYLGTSCWILMTNLLVYQTLLSRNPFQWHWIIVTVVFLGAPFLYSNTLENSAISRSEMLNLYSPTGSSEDVTYLARGEFVVRTAAWLSTLILLFTFVKNQTIRR